MLISYSCLFQNLTAGIADQQVSAYGHDTSSRHRFCHSWWLRIEQISSSEVLFCTISKPGDYKDHDLMSMNAQDK